MRLRLVLLAAMIVPLAACGTAIAGEPVAADVEVFELSTEIPACGKPDVQDYGPGTVSAYDVDDDTVSLTVDGEKVEAGEGDEVPARGGALVVVSVADTVTLWYVPAGDTRVTAASGTHAC